MRREHDLPRQEPGASDSGYLAYLTTTIASAAQQWTDPKHVGEAKLGDVVAAIDTLTVAMLHVARQLALTREANPPQPFSPPRRAS